MKEREMRFKELDFCGRSRDSLKELGFSFPMVTICLLEKGKSCTIESATLRLQLALSSMFQMVWYVRAEKDGDTKWVQVAKDANLSAFTYQETESGILSKAALSDPAMAIRNYECGSVSHSMQLCKSSEHIYGLGEASGELNHIGKKISLHCSDSMGYDAKSSASSLYKHFPFIIVHKELSLSTRSCYGMLYDDMTRCEFDFGNTISAFQGSNRHFSSESTSLEFYFINGPSMQDVVHKTGRYLIGRPIIPPIWSLGYVASAMTYADASDAQEQLQSFPQLCKSKHQMPCSGFYLSSGYTMSSQLSRNVFTWNHERVPDPSQISRSMHETSMRVIPNVKPWLLTSHPFYEDALQKQLFLEYQEKMNNSSGETYFWKGNAGTYDAGKYLDFFNENTRQFWSLHVQQALCSFGFVHALWNDNNEYETEARQLCSITDEAGKLMKVPIGQVGRTTQSMLMAKTSLSALLSQTSKEQEPPLVVSRSGCIGIHRYSAQTWSGDNDTSWETMKYNITMSLQLGLGLWVGNGFDIGGFTGKRVSKELFVRWVAIGVWFAGRFTIHSATWKDNSDAIEGAVNSPWMFPSVEPYIRSLIQLRHQLLSLYFSLYIEAYLLFNPLTRPLVFHYCSDSNPRARKEGVQFLVGDNLLVCGICEENATSVEVYFPIKTTTDEEFWVDVETGDVYQGGETQMVAAELTARFTGVPVFIRNNTGILLRGRLNKPNFKDGENLEDADRRLYLCSHCRTDDAQTQQNAEKQSVITASWFEAEDRVSTETFLEVTVTAFGTVDNVTLETISLSIWCLDGYDYRKHAVDLTNEDHKRTVRDIMGRADVTISLFDFDSRSLAVAPAYAEQTKKNDDNSVTVSMFLDA